MLPLRAEAVALIDRHGVTSTVAATPFLKELCDQARLAERSLPTFRRFACGGAAVPADLVLAANLIDRLYSPRRFLSSIHERMNPGGILVITSPSTWLEEFTKKEEWLGGYKQDGENVTTLDGLTAILSPRFRLLGEPRDVPFIIRETGRKFQHSLAQLTAWELKEK